MRHTLFRACLVLALAGAVNGCSHSKTDPAADERLVGQWQGRVVLNPQKAGELSPGAAEALESTAMTVDFRSDGTMTLTGKDGDEAYESEGTWEVLGEDGDELTIKSIEDEGLEKELSLRFEGLDTFSMPLPDEISRLGAMRFRRLR